MPWKSAKQRKAAYAAASGKGRTGMSRKAAKKMIAHSKQSGGAKRRK